MSKFRVDDILKTADIDYIDTLESKLIRTEKRLAEVEREMDELIIKNNSLKGDQSRLDYLDELNAEMNRRTGTNYGWKVDWNHNRVALNDMGLPKTDVRTAIDNYKSLVSMQSMQQLNGGE